MAAAQARRLLHCRGPHDWRAAVDEGRRGRRSGAPRAVDNTKNWHGGSCGHECHYVQRPAEHPFIKRLVPTINEQRAARKALALGPQLPYAIERILDNNAWFFTVTGAHAGGGLDSTVIIQKTESGVEAAGIHELPEEEQPAAAAAAASMNGATAAAAVPVAGATTAMREPRPPTS